MGRVGEEVKGWRWSGSKLCEMATFLGGGFLSKGQGFIYPARMSRDHTSEAYRVKKLSELSPTKLPRIRGYNRYDSSRWWWWKRENWWRGLAADEVEVKRGA
jgi:hypothetical protein